MSGEARRRPMGLERGPWLTGYDEGLAGKPHDGGARWSEPRDKRDYGAGYGAGHRDWQAEAAREQQLGDPQPGAPRLDKVDGAARVRAAAILAAAEAGLAILRHELGTAQDRTVPPATDVTERRIFEVQELIWQAHHLVITPEPHAAHVTEAGRVVTIADLGRWAAEAEEGYDISRLRPLPADRAAVMRAAARGTAALPAAGPLPLDEEEK